MASILILSLHVTLQVIFTIKVNARENAQKKTTKRI